MQHIKWIELNMSVYQNDAVKAIYPIFLTRSFNIINYSICLIMSFNFKNIAQT